MNREWIFWMNHQILLSNFSENDGDNFQYWWSVENFYHSMIYYFLKINQQLREIFIGVLCEFWKLSYTFMAYLCASVNIEYMQ